MKSTIAEIVCSRARVPVLALLLMLASCATGGDSTVGTPEDLATAEAGEIDVETLVAAALEARESAEVLWQHGDLEASLATLDQAYEILLQIPDDPNLVGQSVYAQGLFFDAGDQIPAPPFRLTNALRVTFSAP